MRTSAASDAKPARTRQVNPDFVEYEAWLNKLYERLLDHVTQHICM